MEMIEKKKKKNNNNNNGGLVRFCFVIPEEMIMQFRRPTPTKKNTNCRLFQFLRTSLSNCLCGHQAAPPPPPDQFHDTAGVLTSGKEVTGDNPRVYGYPELYIGSNGFHKSGLLGSGGFGRVYKAVLPSDGTTVAVKCVAERGGARVVKTFAAELLAVAQLRHRNLVRLRGWCVHADELLLVYDYMPNHSLDRLLFNRHGDQLQLKWRQRKRIVSGLAAALFYLHEQLETQIIHRDVKTSNVMLDSDYNAKLGDFGLARWLEHEAELPELSRNSSSSLSNSLSTSSTYSKFRISDTSKIGGTIGYLPPESFRRKNTATAKSDVFSFGIVLLEVVTGRKAVDLTYPDDQIMLLDSIRRLNDAGKLDEAIDSRLKDEVSVADQEMKKVLQLGLLCSLNDPQARPTMKWSAEVLSGDLSGELPTLPSFKGVADYVSLSSSSSSSETTTTTTTTSSRSSTSSLAGNSASVYVTANAASFSMNSDSTSTTWNPATLPAVDTPREIPYKELISATNDFSSTNMVSELDFGTAYRGRLPNGGHEILVKRLGMKTCPALRARFVQELINLGRLRHRHLIQLCGWCTEEGEMLVVYDYLAHGRSLSKFLFQSSKFKSLKWRQRRVIVKSLASAVLYLHEEWEDQVIHRCISSSSVFLGVDLNPRLGAFALAEFLTRNAHGHTIQNSSGSVRGIFGYMSPEYMSKGAATTKSDVYGFGVVVLEIVCGRMAVDFRHPDALLVKKVRTAAAAEDSVREWWNNGLVDDDMLEIETDEDDIIGVEVERLMKLGLVCTGSDPESRPNMREIVSILDGGKDELLERMVVESRKESKEEWELKNGESIGIIRRIQALGIH